MTLYIILYVEIDVNLARNMIFSYFKVHLVACKKLFLMALKIHIQLQAGPFSKYCHVNLSSVNVLL